MEAGWVLPSSASPTAAIVDDNQMATGSVLLRFQADAVSAPP